MLRGLYTSGLGMNTQMNRLNIIANNIANVDTTGFKREVSLTQTFSEELMVRLNDPGTLRRFSQPVGTVHLGTFIDDIFVDFSQGGLRHTGRSLDLALSDRGFFAVEVILPDGETETRYTRNGSFVLGPDGLLRTIDGSFVLNADGGQITLPTGEITIHTDGTIRVNGELVTQLMLVDFENPQSLRQTGDTMFSVTEDSIFQAFTGGVFQGYLERSNINPVAEMVDMIAAQRKYDLNQRAVLMHDRHMDHIVNTIARR